MLSMPMVTWKTKIKNWSQSSTTYLLREKNLRKKLTRSEASWPASISKWIWGWMNWTPLKEDSTKDWCHKITSLLASITRSKMQCKIYSTGSPALRTGWRWIIRSWRDRFLRSRSNSLKQRKLIMLSSSTKLASASQKPEIESWLEWKRIIRQSRRFKKWSRMPRKISMCMKKGWGS